MMMKHLLSQAVIIFVSGCNDNLTKIENLSFTFLTESRRKVKEITLIFVSLKTFQDQVILDLRNLAEN